MATKGNLNNHIGVPLTLLSIPPDTEIAIIEMGANHQQEIGFLCSIAQPTHGLITNVGKAHLEGFGGFEGVKKGKGELYTYLSQTGGTVFINGANTHLSDMAAEVPPDTMIVYNLPGPNITGKVLSSDPFLELTWEYLDRQYQVTSNLTGQYNLDNILAAICIGNYFGLSPQEINAGITDYQPTNNRSQVQQTANNRLICDYYNANPASMLVALDNLHLLPATAKAMILGDMFELGDESHEEHRVVLEKALGIEAARRIFVGEEFYKFNGQYPGAEFYKTNVEARDGIEKNPVKGTTLLLKGSRGMKLESLVSLL